MKQPLQSNLHEGGLECPFCSRLQDATTSVSKAGGMPKAGDITMCLDCGEIAVFRTKPLRLRKPTEKEYLELAAEETVKRMRAVWVAHKQAEENAKVKTFNTFRPWTEEFEAALDGLVGNERNDVAILSWRLFFYSGALMAYGRVGELKGGYGDFMLAIGRMVAELENELRAVHDDGIKQGIYVDAPDDPA